MLPLSFQLIHTETGNPDVQMTVALYLCELFRSFSLVFPTTHLCYFTTGTDTCSV